MTTLVRTASAASLLLACSGAALAVPYTLPSGPNIAQAKLSGPIPGTYAVVCDSRSGVPCDVAPGTYQLQTFDQTWQGTRQNVVVSADSGTGDESTRTLVSEECAVQDDDDEPASCIASCPIGTQATGGSCLAENQFRVNNVPEMFEVVPSGGSADETSYSCSANRFGADGLDDDGIGRVIAIYVSVYCE